MDDLGIVHGDIARLQLEVDHIGVVNHGRVDARREHVLAIGHIDHLLAREQAVVLCAGQDAQAAVFAGGFGGGQPDGRHFHGLERPVAAVLMPEDALTVLGRFGDIMRRPHGAVGADELLDDIHQPVVAHQPVHEGVGHQHVVAEFLGPDAGVALGQPVDVLGGFAGQVGVDGFADDDVTFVVVFLFQVGHGWRLLDALLETQRHMRITRPL